MTRCAQRIERGQAIVEFALILPVLALLAFGVIDFGRLFTLHGALAGAAGEAARYCARHPGDSTGTLARAAGALEDMAVTELDVDACPLSAEGEEVTVTLSASFVPATPLISSITGGAVRVSVPSTASAGTWR